MINDGRVVAVDAPAALGGRAQRAATVVWHDRDGPHQVSTETPTRVVAELTARLAGEYAEVPGLQVLRPTLEDVYLSLIGQHTAPSGTAAPPRRQETSDGQHRTPC